MKQIMDARSILFVPGNRPERFSRALSSGADAIVLDLEDAVGSIEKPAARLAVMDYLAAPRSESVRVGVRVNHIGSRDGIADLAALYDSPVSPDFILLPKVEAAAEVELTARLMAEGGKAPEIICTIESARGLLACAAIGSAHPLVTGLALGGADLVADLRAELTWETLFAARCTIVHVASMHAIGAFDVPWFDIRDIAGVGAEAKRVRSLGFTGKLAIHPLHVPGINAAFTPSATEIADAQEILDLAATAGGNAASWRGRMIDEAILRSARRLMSRARATPDHFGPRRGPK